MEETTSDSQPDPTIKQLNAVIIESNVVFDFGFGRDQNVPYLIELAENAKVDLIIPNYALVEADGRSVSIIQGRERKIDAFSQFLAELGRGAVYQSTVPSLRQQLDELLSNCNQDRMRFRQTIEDLRQLCTVIPQTPQAHVMGELRFKSAGPPFKPDDCQIYEAILEFARSQRSNFQSMLFLTKDREDFDWEEVQDELSSLSIEIYFSSGECIRHLRELLTE